MQLASQLSCSRRLRTPQIAFLIDGSPIDEFAVTFVVRDRELRSRLNRNAGVRGRPEPVERTLEGSARNTTSEKSGISESPAAQTSR